MKKPSFISIVCLVIFFAYSFDLYAQDSLPKSNAVPTGERVNTRTVTNEDFDKIVLQSNIPVLVNFFADWSGPCKTQAPILGELAQELDGKVKFVKVDIDMEGNKDLAVEYGVLSVPTLILFSNGETKETMVGVTSKSKLKQKLEQANLQKARSESEKVMGKRLQQESVINKTIEERVKEIIIKQMGVSKDQVMPETSFINDLGADSLDTVELVMELEDAFDINIPDEDAEKIQTVGDAINYVEKNHPFFEEPKEDKSKPNE